MPLAFEIRICSTAGRVDLGLDDGAAGLLSGKVGARQEDLADRQQGVLRLVPGAPDLLPEEGDRDLHMDAGAVAGLAVGIDRAPVPHRLQGGDAVRDHLAPGQPVDGGNQPDTARGVLLLGQIHAVTGQAVAGRLVGLDPALVDNGSGHWISHGRLSPPFLHAKSGGRKGSERRYWRP